MNLQTNSNNTPNKPLVDDLDDFEFKPITSGLGFNQTQLTTEIKPAFVETPVQRPIPSSSVARTSRPMNNDQMLYQSDLALFYNQDLKNTQTTIPESKKELEFSLASKTVRSLAYLLDLMFITSVVSLVLVIMARLIDVDLLETWMNYPNEITPLVLSLFTGFYLIYFSIFEKTNQGTIGKNLFSIRVVSNENKLLGLNTLVMRSCVSLLNFVSLGLFSYFDLQNKVTNSKVVRVK